MRTRWVAVVCVAAAVVAGCDLPAAVALPLPAPPTPGSAAGSALAALVAMPVKGRAPKTGYTRAQFGPAWADTDHDGCDQRNQVLARDLTGVVRRGRCVVLSGSLHDPYSDTTVAFTRGPVTSERVQIDHVVALSNAWQTGAQALDAVSREMVATDPANLMAVAGGVNQSKGDGDAATWLPPAKAFRCAYVARQVAVKTRYRLWVTAAERDAIGQVLAACPDQKLP